MTLNLYLHCGARSALLEATLPRVGLNTSVFHNRLARGMRLETDPSVIYGIPDFDGNLRRVHLEDESNPYNTYQRDGLPPGPIANPGRDSLAAVLQPAKSKDLYFVADGTGGHAFARTLEEHNRNVARWRRLQRQQRNQ